MKHLRIEITLIISLCLILCFHDTWATITIHVTPTGNSQTTLGDLKQNPNVAVTLEQALNLLKDKTLRNTAGDPKEDIIIRLDSGTYRLNKTLQIDADSNGSIVHPITIEGPSDKSAIITGGQAVNGFLPVSDILALSRLSKLARQEVLQADVTQEGITDFGLQKRHGFTYSEPTALEVFYRNQPMTLARWPNQGFAKIDTLPNCSRWLNYFYKIASFPCCSMVFNFLAKTASLPSCPEGLGFTVENANLKNWLNEPALLATGYFMYYWADLTAPVQSIDLSNQSIYLSEPAPKFGMKVGQSVFFQNALAELDQAGEWYLDNAHGLLYLWPPKPLLKNDIEVSILEKLLVIDNASNIKFSNLTFQSVRGNGISILGGNHILLAHSTIRNIGNNAVSFIDAQNSGLNDMLIEDIGDKGVMLVGGDRQGLVPANLYVENSIIRRFGRISRTSHPGILLGGVGNKAIKNKIYDSPYIAIMFNGNDHLISSNEIYDVCKDSGDVGAIYTGRSWTQRGTVISDNQIHDIPPNIDLGRTRAIYLDDQASGITIIGNQFKDIGEAIFIGGGRDNIIKKNTFLRSNIIVRMDARGLTWHRSMVSDEKQELLIDLHSVPYNQKPYKERYPNLANILEDQPGNPKYNIFKENMIIGDSKMEMEIEKEAQEGIDIQY